MIDLKLNFNECVTSCKAVRLSHIFLRILIFEFLYLAKAMFDFLDFFVCKVMQV